METYFDGKTGIWKTNGERTKIPIELRNARLDDPKWWILVDTTTGMDLGRLHETEMNDGKRHFEWD